MNSDRPALEITVDRAVTLAIVGAVLTFAVVRRQWAIGAGGLLIAFLGRSRIDFKTASAWWINMIGWSAVAATGAYHLFGHMIPASAPALHRISVMILIAATLCKVVLIGMGRVRKVWTFTRSESVP